MPQTTQERKIKRFTIDDIQKRGRETMPAGMTAATSGRFLKLMSAMESTIRKALKAPKAIREIEKITTPLERVMNL